MDLFQLFLAQWRDLLKPLASALPTSASPAHPEPDPEDPNQGPLAEDGDTPAWWRLLATVGWQPDLLATLDRSDVENILREVSTVVDTLSATVDSDGVTFLGVLELLRLVDDVRDLTLNFGQLVENAPPGFAQVGLDLLRAVTAQHLAAELPALYGLMRLANAIELPEPPDFASGAVIDPTKGLLRTPYAFPSFHPERLFKLLRNPFGYLRQTYYPVPMLATGEEARRAADALFPRLADALNAVGIAAAYRPTLSPGERAELPLISGLSAGTLKAALGWDEESEAADLTLSLASAAEGDLGLVIVPRGTTTAETERAGWRFSFSLTPGVEAVALGPNGPTLLAAPGTSRATLKLSLAPADTAGAATLFIGDMAGAHLRLAGVRFDAEITVEQSSSAQSYSLSFAAGPGALSLPGLAEITWQELSWAAAKETTTLTLRGLRIAAELIPGLALAGDLTLVFRDGELQTGSTLTLREPQAITLPLTDLELDGQSFTVSWEESDPARWLRFAAGGLFDEAPPAPATLALRVIFGKPLREIRLDWAFSAAARNLGLPGFRVTTPDAGTFSLVWSDGGDGMLDRLALILTLSEELTAASTFAWGRDDDSERELQNDGRKQGDPLFALRLRPAERTSLVLLDLDLGGGASALPKFFRQLQHALDPLTADPAAPRLLVDLDAVESLGASWQAWFTVNAKAVQDAFELPFLKNGPIGQAITIRAPEIQDKLIDLSAAELPLPFELTVKVGDLQFDTDFQAALNLRTFALSIDHGQGIKLYSSRPSFETPAYLGMRWRLSAPGAANERRHYLTLATANGDYAVLQAPGALLELEFDAISEEPIIFRVRDFAIRASGISLTADVSPEPVRLKGLNTKFSFRNSELRLVDNGIQALTLAGTGALPPDLVGDATVNVQLNFARGDDKALKLLSGSAALALNKPLESHATRFRFSISRLDVGFVPEGKYHLYFMLTGSAEFALQDGDDAEGPLALLPKIKIDLVKAPLTGDASVIARHVDFLITLPRPISFNFFGCFEMELRSVGFRPQAEVFDGDGAMELGGQLRFAQGDGDNQSPKRDYHSLFIGLPKPGGVFPRLYLNQLPVSLAIPGAFRIDAVVDFIESAEVQGFSGEGKLEIRGLPLLEAAFSFVRVRRADNAWVRAWFIALNVGKLALLIPVVQVYIREIGLGFGYRYTIAAIKAADEIEDVKKLIAALDVISRTQGDLARRESWKVDIETPPQSLRWTIAFRAMIAQTAGSVGIGYDETVEENLRCLFLFDALFVFRSNFTFFINARGWFNTNYNDYLRNIEGTRGRPFVTGYMLLHPPRKRFLARLVNNPNGSLGVRPKLPAFVETALRSVRFSITLLIEPGLVHLDLGWPDKLRWKVKLGPLLAEYRGGMIFRVVARGGEKELVMGVSSRVRAELDFRAEVDLGIVGIRVRVYAEVAYSLRYIGVLSLSDPLGESAFYARVGLEIRVRLEVTAWIDLWLFEASGTFSLEVQISAALELGINGIKPDGIGLRGTATLALRVFGRSIGFSIDLAVGRENVEAVVARTARYDAMGLSSDDDAGNELPDPEQAGTQTARAANVLGGAVESAVLLLGGPGDEPLVTPHYTVFAIARGSATYFVIFPSAVPEAAGEHRVAATGFLPVPPLRDVTVEHDFVLRLPGSAVPAGTTLTHLNGGEETLVAAGGEGGAEQIYGWRANWKAIVATARRRQEGGRVVSRDGQDAPLEERFTLERFLRESFADSTGNAHDPGALTSVEEAPLEDPRVDSPSESDVEAAVRGAIEQFRGSPYFKFDERNAYDQTLAAAFSSDTTIYSPAGRVTGSAEERERERIEQFRGHVIQTIVDEFRAYVADPEAFGRLDESLAFQLGLVFRCDGPTPAWLHEQVADDESPQITQRLGNSAVSPPEGLAVPRYLRLFNTSLTSFKAHPPAFSRVRSYSSANTIAISWTLAWDHLGEAGYSPEQADPEQHLAHYQVRRRALDSSERDLSYNVKPAQVLHRSENAAGESLLQRLQPRFNIVDHFNHETLAEQAALPASGLRYLYSITPVDYAGGSGRPLSLVVARLPDEPPVAPTEARLLVRYRLSDTAPVAELVERPTLLQPILVLAEWDEPPPPQGAPAVPVATYRLVFRRDETLPVGSYGLDSATRGDRPTTLPGGQARVLPGDIVLELNRDEVVEGMVMVPITGPDGLIVRGILPADSRWRPEAWHIFIQAVAVNGTPSSLAPVQVAIEFERSDPATGAVRREERRLATLEWLPGPLALPLIPPEDQRARAGDALFPMPVGGAGGAGYRFGGAIADVRHLPHPTRIRAIRFRWNQGPSSNAAYPTEIHAGYRLLELDVDAHTDQTFNDRELLAAALRQIQEVQLIPDDDALITPTDTLATSRWEAWYPSTRERRATDRGVPYGSWYSWRESILEWPAWPGLTERLERDPSGRPRPRRSTPAHPFLTRLLETLAGLRFTANLAAAAGLDTKVLSPLLTTLFADHGLTLTAPVVAVIVPERNWEITQTDPSRTFFLRVVQSVLEVYEESEYIVDQMAVPPSRAGDLAELIKLLPPTADPYGWGVLQQLGLSVTVGLRYRRTREPIPGEELLRQLQGALQRHGAKQEAEALAAYLHVETLFQPGRAVELDEGLASAGGEGGGLAAQPDALLAIAQISLRPVVRQLREYGVLALRCPEPVSFDLIVALAAGERCSVIDAENPAAGQIELERERPTDPEPRITITRPKGGNVGLRLRAARLPEIRVSAIIQVAGAEPREQMFTWVSVAATASAGRLKDEWLPGEGKGPPDVTSAWRAAFAGHGLAAARPCAPQRIEPFTDAAASFTVPESLAAEFASQSASPPLDQHGSVHWLRLKRYLESLNREPEQAILLPTAANAIEPILSELLAWTQRFFDHGGVPAPLPPGARLSDGVTPDAGIGRMRRTASGPWLATAYPRAGTPALVALDNAGRLRYDQLIPDRWGHILRYYLRPYDRYERLWVGVLGSETLFGEGQAPHTLTPTLPNPQDGALDVVIERTEPVAAPVVLRSARLDEPSEPGSPAPPGPTWEVIVAEHPEQRLSESNQTLARRLDFRHVAFTLLRRFAYGSWHQYLVETLDLPEDRYALVTEIYPTGELELPGAYPEILDHLPLTPPATPSEAYESGIRSLELPLRVPAFQQGYMALQWQGLPFFYEHRLLLFAQAAALASPVAEVTQRDFAYRSPVPEATSGGRIHPGWSRDLLFFAPPPHALPTEPPAPPAPPVPPAPQGVVRGRRLDIPLRSLWASLPEDAWSSWPAENPAQAGGVPERKVKYGALPDPEVVYQLIELFNGNVEVQAELFFNQKPADAEAPADPADDDIPNVYVRRQLGRRFLAERPTLAAPPADSPAGAFSLATTIYEVAEEPLSRNYRLPNVPELQARIFFREHLLSVFGVFTFDDQQALHKAMDLAKGGGTTEAVLRIDEDKARVSRLYDSWFSEEPVSIAPTAESLAALDPVLQSLLSVPAPSACILVWVGSLQASQRDALLADLDAATPNFVDGDVEFKAALRRLIREAAEPGAGPTTRVSAPLGLDQLPDELGADVSLDLAGEPKLTIVARPAGAPAETSSLTVRADATHYTGLEWRGPLYDEDQLPRLRAALARWSPTAVFGATVEALLQRIEARAIQRELSPARPRQQDLSPELGARLTIAATSLSWSGAAPDGPTGAALAAIVADRAFHEALSALLARLADPQASALLPEPPPVEPPVEPPSPPPDPLTGLPIVLGKRLGLSGAGAERRLLWAGAVPDDAEQTVLDAFLGTPTGASPELVAAVRAIAAALAASRTATLGAGPLRPYEGDQDALLRPQLVITATGVRWRGRLVSRTQRAALAAIAVEARWPDPEFRAAITAILTALEGEPVSGELTLPKRRLIDPPAWLAQGLLIGRALLRYHGLMDADEGRTLLGLFATAPDQAAVQRLYEATLAKGMRGRALLIRTRRASAPPSAPQPILPEQLA